MANKGTNIQTLKDTLAAIRQAQQKLDAEKASQASIGRTGEQIDFNRANLGIGGEVGDISAEQVGSGVASGLATGGLGVGDFRSAIDAIRNPGLFAANTASNYVKNRYGFNDPGLGSKLGRFAGKVGGTMLGGPFGGVTGGLVAGAAMDYAGDLFDSRKNETIRDFLEDTVSGVGDSIGLAGRATYQDLANANMIGGWQNVQHPSLNPQQTLELNAEIAKTPEFITRNTPIWEPDYQPGWSQADIAAADAKALEAGLDPLTGYPIGHTSRAFGTDPMTGDGFAAPSLNPKNRYGAFESLGTFSEWVDSAHAGSSEGPGPWGRNSSGPRDQDGSGRAGREQESEIGNTGDYGSGFGSGSGASDTA